MISIDELGWIIFLLKVSFICGARIPAFVLRFFFNFIVTNSNGFLKNHQIFFQNPKKILNKIIRVLLRNFFKYPIPSRPCWYVQKWTPYQHLHVNNHTWENLLDSDESWTQKPFVSVQQCVQWRTLARYKKVPGIIKTIMVSISSKYMKFSEALFFTSWS